MSSARLSGTVTILLIICTYIPGYAKVRIAAQNESRYSAKTPTALHIRELEARLKPFFEYKLKRRSGKDYGNHKNIQLNEADLFQLAKTWSSLSTEFKKLYLASIEIPQTALSFNSPGGHFEIFYYSDGADSVDITDNYGFTKDNWRIRADEANGVPDYIDETGYALDSAWSMEVDRFGFIAPHVYKNSFHSSDRYKVLVEHQEPGFYGITNLSLPASDSDGVIGFSSYISLRNTWNTPEWFKQGYDKRPIDAIRVTCAHEFFHAIQYSMCWEVESIVYLDDFPVCWIEGSAVSMEELAFDSINDYHQYATTYFYDPEMPFFKDVSIDAVYSNTLLFIFLQHHGNDNENIDFIKEMLFSNYNENKLPFYQNLLNAGAVHGSSWSEQYHAFHCNSLYSGKNSGAENFIPDAPDLPDLRITPLDTIDSIERRLPANSGYFVRLIKEKEHSDTLQITVSSAFDQNATLINNTYPLVSVLLYSHTSDSLIPITDGSDNTDSITINGWHKWDSLTITATNANPNERATVAIELHTTLYNDNDEFVAFPNPLSIKRHKGALNLRGSNISRIRIYSLDGSLVHVINPQISSLSTIPIPHTYQWEPQQHSRPCAPGTYTLLIEQNNPDRKTRKKVMIVP